MSTPDKKKSDFDLPLAITYYLSLPFIYLVSLLPFRALYRLSDFFYFIIFDLIGYRKKVVLQNLRNSFPEKNRDEINALCSLFYHNLCDFFLETIKTITVSEKTLLKRCEMSPEALTTFSKFAGSGENIIIMMGHIGNWEWACNSFNIQCSQQLYVIYHPLSNQYFNDLMYRLRTRTGTKLIAMKDTYREMAANKNGLNATVFVADQTPRPDHAYWTTFLNQDTPVFKGAESIAKKMDLPVVYASMKKAKRGYYQMNAEILIEHPRDVTDGELSDMFIKRLEKDIQSHPETWLWSHRRWKHKRPNADKISSPIGTNAVLQKHNH